MAAGTVLYELMSFARYVQRCYRAIPAQPHAAIGYRGTAFNGAAAAGAVLHLDRLAFGIRSLPACRALDRQERQHV